MKATAYLRVSTDEQTTANQRAAVQELARARGLELDQVLEEVESARKRRPVREALLEQARRGKVGAIVLWSLDRLDRSMLGAISTVLELDRLGVRVISVREPWLDQAGPTRSLLIAVFGWVAEQEVKQISERTKAGLARTRREGTRLGRPRASPIACGIADRLVRDGKSLRAACRAAGVSVASYRRWLARQQAQGEPEGAGGASGPPQAA